MHPSRFVTGLVIALASVPAWAIVARNYNTTFIAHAAEARTCQDAAHAPALRGTAMAQYHVGGNGKMDSFRVVSTSDPALGNVVQCIGRAAARWQFSMSSTGGSREVTFTFAPDAPVSIR